MTKKIIKKMLVVSLSSMILCGTIAFSSNAWGQSYYDPDAVSLGQGTTGTYSTDHNESNASFEGTATSTSTANYTVKLTVDGSLAGTRYLPANGTKKVTWSGLLRDHNITWKLYNGGGTTLVSKRTYATY